MDPEARAATIELAKRLPAMLHAAIAIHGQYPNLDASRFRVKMEEAVGVMPSRAKLPPAALPDLYKKVMNVLTVPPGAHGALSSLEKALAMDAVPLNHAPLNTLPRSDSLTKVFEQINQRAPLPENEFKPHMKAAPPPETIDVVCCGNYGTFITQSQAIICHCPNCKSVAKRLGKRELVLSPTEFERTGGV